MTSPTQRDEPEAARRQEPPETADTGPRPRTGGEVTGMGPIQIALGLLAFFIVLLVIWILWPLLSGA